MKLPFVLEDPRGLWLLTALLPLILFYVLKVRRARSVVGSTWLWKAAQRDLLARSPFRRLRAEIPLLLQALAIIVLAIALSKPATRQRAVLGDHVAIVIDTSASMSAVDAKGVARITLAKEAAIRALESLSPGADALVLEAAREARLVAPADRDVRRLTDKVEKLVAQDVEGDLGAAIALAVDRLKQLGGDKRILVFTDGALAHPENLTQGALPMDVLTVGEPIDNAAIVRVDVRSGQSSATHEEEVQAFALLVNFGTAPRDVFVTLRLSNVDEPLASRRLRLAPGERAPVVLTFKPTRGDRGKGLLIEMAPHDAMAADDIAFARVPPGQRQPAVLVSERPSPWLERALTSDPDVELWKGTEAESAHAPVEDGALWVFDGVCPKAIPAGDFLIAAPPKGTCLGVGVGADIDKPAITSWNNGDPRLRFLTLDGVHLAKSAALSPDGPSQSLIRGQHETLAADVPLPGHTGTILGFDVGETDWPLKASFVLFLRNVIEQTRAHHAMGQAGPAHAGEPLRVAVSTDVTFANVAAPGEKEPREIPTRAGLAVVADTSRAGFYLVSWAGTRPGSQLIPVSLTSERESDLRPKKQDSAKTEVKVASAAALGDAHLDAAWVIATLALLLIAADAWWLTKKPRAVRAIALPRPENRA